MCRFLSQRTRLAEREPDRLETGVYAGLNVMAGFGPLRSGSLHAGFWSGERV